MENKEIILSKKFRNNYTKIQKAKELTPEQKKIFIKNLLKHYSDTDKNGTKRISRFNINNNKNSDNIIKQLINNKKTRKYNFKFKDIDIDLENFFADLPDDEVREFISKLKNIANSQKQRAI